MDVDKYITDEVLDAAHGVWISEGRAAIVAAALRAGVLAQHRADVLREEADEYERASTAPLSQADRDLWAELEKRYQPGGPDMPVIWLRYRADLAEGAVGS